MILGHVHKIEFSGSTHEGSFDIERWSSENTIIIVWFNFLSLHVCVYIEKFWKALQNITSCNLWMLKLQVIYFMLFSKLLAFYKENILVS